MIQKTGENGNEGKDGFLEDETARRERALFADQILRHYKHLKQAVANGTLNNSALVRYEILELKIALNEHYGIIGLTSAQP
jgi:hypothetical protein